VSGTNPSGQEESREFILKPLICPRVTGDLIIGADALSRFNFTRDRQNQTICAFEKSPNQITLPTASFSRVQEYLFLKASSVSLNPVLPFENITEYQAILQAYTFQSTSSIFRVTSKSDDTKVICEVHQPHA
jgi:hypothetical protein